MTSLPIPRTHAARRATPTGPSVSVLDRNHVTPTAQSWVRTGAATHAAIPLGARPVAGPVTIVPMARETKGHPAHLAGVATIPSWCFWSDTPDAGPVSEQPADGVERPVSGGLKRATETRTGTKRRTSGEP
jgi:hypothetical protein